jgi:hypothetical protein
MINWIPRELPPHVRIIVTLNFNSPKASQLSGFFKRYFGNYEFLVVEPFLKIENNTVDTALLNKYILTIPKFDRKSENSTYKPEIMTAFLKFVMDITDKDNEKTVNPLYCRLLFQYIENILSFRTFMHLAQDFSPISKTNPLVHLKNIKSVVDKFFGHLESEYGDLLVKRILGYIAIYQYCGGITQNELIDLVSLDKQVVNSLYHDKALYKCFPESVWIQFKNSLMKLDCLHEVHNQGGFRCLTFKHKVFYDVVYDKYIQTRDRQWNYTSFHKNVVSYYLNEHEKLESIQAALQPIEQKSG